MSDVHLKLCPFCGQDGAEFKILNGRHGQFGFIQCQICFGQASTVSVTDSHTLSYIKREAAALWNMRNGELDE